ncbi:hypothetical protein CWI42_091150 [Ordospora colligata]|uniref:Uncharacterized protein n=1 Tax=Ordospora colligata OC4 TaxID=1354746 RepID=A0A0B2UIY1_9MICR|nr:uncharacterized protein M896_091170 [Ordospora colligata OC4]KHN69189.1 hypothetical protein M896_091170 [Ordospora colligata OC4]TBU14467.1 hypothetical protein CWI40_091130 [Ordospora colligata]TBU14644.1 hypothetical protein CWI41_091160 [Ordospora colligata]TBU18029.1 hypothetical protein CWI42_091150 [Ordospora colligata]
MSTADRLELKARIRLRLLEIDNALVEYAGLEKIHRIRQSVRISINTQNANSSRIIKPRASTKHIM